MDMPQPYAGSTLLKNLKARIKYGFAKKMRIKCDMYVREYETYAMHLEDRKAVGYYRRDYWTDDSPAELQTAGYLRVYGLYDSILFAGVPIYLRVHGLKKFDITARDPETGKLLYSQDTAATLHDSMSSTATKEFIRGMAKKSMSSMDSQKIIMIGLIGVGAVIGMWALGVF